MWVSPQRDPLFRCSLDEAVAHAVDLAARQGGAVALLKNCPHCKAYHARDVVGMGIWIPESLHVVVMYMVCHKHEKCQRRLHGTAVLEVMLKDRLKRGCELFGKSCDCGCMTASPDASPQ